MIKRRKSIDEILIEIKKAVPNAVIIPRAEREAEARRMERMGRRRMPAYTSPPQSPNEEGGDAGKK